MITLICGIPGAGKTSYLAKLAIDSMLNGRFAYNSWKRESTQMNTSGANFELPPQRHLVYCDTNIHYGKRLCTYSVNGFEIGLSHPFGHTVFLPYYSTILLDEAQRYYDSRMSKYLRSEVYNWYQLHRHGDYNVYLACQSPANIDVNLRRIIQRVIVFDEFSVKEDEFGCIRKSLWSGREFMSADSAEAYMLDKENGRSSNLGKSFSDSCDYNILSCYNSKSCRPAFLAGNYSTPVEYYTEKGYQFTLSSFVEYNNTHLFSAPEGFWKNPTRDKLILEKMGVKNYEYQ